MGKRLSATIYKHHGSIKIEWVQIGNRSKPLILFLHGFSDRKENFYFAAKTLSKEFDIIIPDMPGFGNNTPDNDLVYSLENYEKWLGEFIDANHINDFHLVGNSLGGAVCTKLADRYSQRIKSLSLIDPAGFYIPEMESIYDEALNGVNLFQVRSPDEYETFRSRIFHKKPTLPNFVKEYMINSAVKNQKWYGKIFNELANINQVKDKVKTIEEISLNSNCEKIKVPTKIFWGKHDTLFPYQTADFLKKKIKGSETCIFENIGHCPHLENPKQFSHELNIFINRMNQ